jgi:S-adenosylmethionine/arginine decarboxylase-like enzyme
MNYWGKHLMLNCIDCNYVYISSKEIIKEFIRELCYKTEMTPIGDVIFYEVEKTKENDEADLTGLTAFQMIKTSNITIHFCNPSGSLYFDFFSCKDYNTADVKELIQKTFLPSRVYENCFYRDTRKGFI